MKRFIDFLLFPILPILTGCLIAILFVIVLMTPNKTPSGQYTDAVKYWFDDNYYQTEFVK